MGTQVSGSRSRARSPSDSDDAHVIAPSSIAVTAAAAERAKEEAAMMESIVFACRALEQSLGIHVMVTNSGCLGLPVLQLKHCLHFHHCLPLPYILHPGSVRDRLKKSVLITPNMRLILMNDGVPPVSLPPSFPMLMLLMEFGRRSITSARTSFLPPLLCFAATTAAASVRPFGRRSESAPSVSLPLFRKSPLKSARERKDGRVGCLLDRGTSSLLTGETSETGPNLNTLWCPDKPTQVRGGYR